MHRLTPDQTTAAKRVIVTTSWDDGHPLDLRLADTLARHRMRGTFYVPIDYPACPRMTWNEVRHVRDMDMEIGARAATHPRMSEISGHDVSRELRQGKDLLEQALDHPVTSFCFPEGQHIARLAPLLRAAGYHSARTTVSFRTDAELDPFAMPVTFQLWPHARKAIAQHALKTGNLRGLAAWAARWGGEVDLPRLAETILNDLERTGGVLHIWGQSWAIEQAGLWPLLDRVLERISHRPGVEYLTNRQLLPGARGRCYQPVSCFA